MKLKCLGGLFGILSYVSLFAPIYSTRIDGKEGYELIIRGFNLAEFSVWGCLLFSIPVLIIAITYSKLNKSWKSMILMALYIFSIIAFYNASIAADTWVREIATGFVMCRPYQIISFACMFASMICSYVLCNGNREISSEEIGESVCLE